MEKECDSCHVADWREHHAASASSSSSSSSSCSFSSSSSSLHPVTPPHSPHFQHIYHRTIEDRRDLTLYSDETIFTIGQHGKVYVHRPPGASTYWNRKYCLEDIQSHGPSVNYWCCFSSRGTGGCETFSNKCTGESMRKILNHHMDAVRKKLFNGGMVSVIV